MKDGKKHHNFRDLSGQKFGALTALHPSHSTGKTWAWVYRCQCGALTTKLGMDVTKELKRGGTPNCGCLTRTLISKGNSTHGMTRHPAYAVWRSMLDRCRLPSHKAWANYGGRGITVAPEWGTFEVFWADMGLTYRRGLDLDRRDNNSGYSKENCRWVSRRTNTMNKRNTLKVDIPELSKQLGIPRSTLYYRLAHNQPLDAPVDKRKATRSTTSSTPAPATGL